MKSIEGFRSRPLGPFHIVLSFGACFVNARYRTARGAFAGEALMCEGPDGDWRGALAFGAKTSLAVGVNHDEDGSVESDICS